MACFASVLTAGGILQAVAERDVVGPRPRVMPAATTRISVSARRTGAVAASSGSSGSDGSVVGTRTTCRQHTMTACVPANGLPTTVSMPAAAGVPRA